MDMKTCSKCKEEKGLNEFRGTFSWCRPCEREYARIRRQQYRKNPSNRAKIIEYMRSYNQRGEVKKRKSEYDKLRKISTGKASKKKREALLKAQSDGTITASFLKDLFSSIHHCIYCCKELKSDAEKHLEHIIPLSKGGKHSWTNVAISCSSCNLSKGAKMPFTPAGPRMNVVQLLNAKRDGVGEDGCWNEWRNAA